MLRLAFTARYKVHDEYLLLLQDLIKEGERLQREQQLVMDHNLAHEYLKPQKKVGRSMIGLKG